MEVLINLKKLLKLSIAAMSTDSSQVGVALSPSCILPFQVFLLILIKNKDRNINFEIL